MKARDYNLEAHDQTTHRYAYEFDYLMHGFMIRAFKPFFVEGKALELGCYQGAFTKRLTAEFNDLTVVDASAKLIELARGQVPNDVQFINSRFEDAELPGQFKSIFLIHTLEHLDEPVVVLEKIKSWLAPGGRLFLATPNANAPSRQIAVKMGLITHNAAVTEAEWEHGHRATYTLDTLEHEVKSSGLQTIHRGGIFFKPFANFQFDELLNSQIITSDYIEGCYQLGMHYPDLCASIFNICTTND